jgi:hypothetical protein
VLLAFLCGEFDSNDPILTVRHGSTVGFTKVRHKERCTSDKENLHSPLVKKTFDGLIFQPPYLFMAVTLGDLGRYGVGKTLSQKLCCDCSEMYEDSIEIWLFGSATW